MDVAPIETLQRRLTDGRQELESLYLQALQRTLFASRSEVRPSMLKPLAAAEVEALLTFFQTGSEDEARRHGAELCQIGLGELSILRLGQATRQLFLGQVQGDSAIATLEAIDTYHHALIQGFLQSREQVILSEQERIRSALQRTLERFSVQMEVAASVAGATTSILDLDELLHTAVELMRQRFDLYYVGLFLTDEDNHQAVLRAGTGEAGRAMLLGGYRLELSQVSMIARAIRSNETRVALDVGREAARFENPLLPDTHSEAAIPLIAHGKAIGALTVQSQRVSAFSDQDVVALRILADQLANAIENARLFAELRRSEEKYRTILDSIEEGYYELDLDSRYRFVNDAMCNILGHPRREILGVEFTSFVDSESSERVRNALRDAFRLGGVVQGVEHKIAGLSDQERVVEASASLMRNLAGEIVGVRGVVRDVSSRRQAERFRIERMALEASNRELEQFAYVASHDLQEPLRKIQAFGDRLSTKSGEALGEEGRDYLQRMLAAAQRMQTLINDLLALSRVATKGQPFVTVDLDKVAREVVSDLEALIDRTGGRVEVGNLPSIDGDPVQIRQLLQNLIGNGLKFHRDDAPPVIRVTASLLPGKRALRGLWTTSPCEIRIADNGIGFDEKYLARIFQPFQRLHGRGEYEGTGIGLTICQRIVERHGGTLTARSQPGQGATFIITVPARHEKGETTL